MHLKIQNVLFHRNKDQAVVDIPVLIVDQYISDAFFSGRI